MYVCVFAFGVFSPNEDSSSARPYRHDSSSLLLPPPLCDKVSVVPAALFAGRGWNRWAHRNECSTSERASERERERKSSLIPFSPYSLPPSLFHSHRLNNKYREWATTTTSEWAVADAPPRLGMHFVALQRCSAVLPGRKLISPSPLHGCPLLPLPYISPYRARIIFLPFVKALVFPSIPRLSLPSRASAARIRNRPVRAPRHRNNSPSRVRALTSKESRPLFASCVSLYIVLCLSLLLCYYFVCVRVYYERAGAYGLVRARSCIASWVTRALLHGYIYIYKYMYIPLFSLAASLSLFFTALSASFSLRILFSLFLPHSPVLPPVNLMRQCYREPPTVALLLLLPFFSFVV